MNSNFAWRLEYSWAVIGAFAALIITLTAQYAKSIVEFFDQPNIFAVIGMTLAGALAGGFMLPMARWLRPQAGRLGIASVSLSIPGVGPVELKLSSAQRLAGWHVFIELATRIATQSLKSTDRQSGLVEISGALRPALNSLYGIFTVVRDELKAMPPSPPPENSQQSTFESYLSQVLNRDLRPFLARWHPRLDDWEATGMPEDQWPLEALCREDLERTRLKLLFTAWELGAAIKIANLQDILPPQPQDDQLQPLILFKHIEQQEQPLPLGNAQYRAGWKIFVEVSSRIPVNSANLDHIDIQQVLIELQTLSHRIRRELKQMPPTPHTAEEVDTVEQISLKLLNQYILPFLLRWQESLKNWQLQQQSQTEWPEQAQCQQDLLKIHQQLHRSMNKLGNLLGVRRLEQILSSQE